MTTIRRLTIEDASRCDEIIAALPYFFADPAGVAEAAEDVRAHEGWVTEDDGRVTGFLTLTWPFPETADITWLAVHPDWRRGGRGRQLVEAAADHVRNNGGRLLMLLMTAEPDAPAVSDGYEGTRRFYRALGFFPLRQLDLARWTDEALVLVRPLSV
jgi:GNAT superfamily N-acetyltransferase